VPKLDRALPEEQRCYGGICNEPVCRTGDPPVCQGGKLLVCNEKGTAFIARECPEGTECEEGERLADCGKDG